MTAIREWAGNFDLGQFLGIGLDSAQIGWLAGALFLALVGLSALHRASGAGGVFPAIWFAAAIGLLATAVMTAARGFPDQVPDELRPWTDPDRLLRTAGVLALFGFAVTLLSAHWVRRPRWRVAVRAVGLGVAGLGVWLAAGWFGDQLPEEARPWAARAVVSRVLAVTGLLFVAWTCWFRPAAESPHRRWAVRTLAVPALALAVVFGLHWFGRSIWEEIPIGDAIQVTVALAAVATGTCGMIAAGAYLLRDRAARRSVRRRTAAISMPTPKATTDRPLPIAVLLDDRGRPILPLPPR